MSLQHLSKQRDTHYHACTLPAALASRCPCIFIHTKGKHICDQPYVRSHLQAYARSHAQSGFLPLLIVSSHIMKMELKTETRCFMPY